MPNWCENKLTLRTRNKEAFSKEFLDALLTPSDEQGLRHLDFEALEKAPEDGDWEWYEIMIGTHRGVHAIRGLSPDRLDGVNVLRLTFLTAWEPPLLWSERLGEAFDEIDVSHTYMEPERDLFGVQKCRGGEVVYFDHDVEVTVSNLRLLGFHLDDLIRSGTEASHLPHAGYLETRLSRSYDSGEFDGGDPVSICMVPPIFQ